MSSQTELSDVFGLRTPIRCNRTDEEKRNLHYLGGSTGKTEQGYPVARAWCGRAHNYPRTVSSTHLVFFLIALALLVDIFNGLRDAAISVAKW
jgi:hypothetical protein